MAIILGILSPLCTFGTIPVVITLYKAGVQKEPLITFLSASSLLNPQLFIMTAGGLGLKFAFIRLGIVGIICLALGLIMLIIPEKQIIKNGIYSSPQDKVTLLNEKPKQFAFKLYFKNFAKQMRFLSKYLVIGSFVGGFIETFIPQQYVLDLFATSTFSSILVAAFAGIPLYACGGGIIPTIAILINQGMSNGAAMSFMTVGQATRISPLMAMLSFLKARFVIGYCLYLVMFTSVLALLFS